MQENAFASASPGPRVLRASLPLIAELGRVHRGRVLVAAATRVLRRLTGDAWAFDPVGAAARVPAIGAALAAGAAAHSPLSGVLAAGGAFTVGFGAPLDLAGSRPLLLVVACIAIGSAAVLGSLAAWHGLSATALAMGMGALVGVAARRSAGLAWVALQCALASVVATSYPSSLAGASKRALLIAAGGLAQAAVLSIARWAQSRPAPPPASGTDVPFAAVRIATGLAISMALVRALGMRNGYWVPLTTLLVLRPAAESTTARALSRTAGTIGGASLASALALALHPSWPWLGVLVAGAAFGAYVFQKATYGLFSVFVTAYVVFLLSFAGLPEGQVAVERVVATALGASIGLAIQAIDRTLRRQGLHG